MTLQYYEGALGEMIRDLRNEEEREAKRKENERIIEEYQTYLNEKGLAEHSIEKHIYNISYFLNEYLLYRDTGPDEALLKMNDFVGNWFIKKTPWVTVSSIQLMISSIKHFYRHRQLQGKISKKDLDMLLSKIKRSQDDWINRFRATNY